MQRVLFTFFWVCLSLIIPTTAFAQTTTTPAAKAIGTGPWADGLTHVMQATAVGRGCLEVTNFRVVNGKALYACLILEDRRYHVIHGTEMDTSGFSEISNLDITADGRITYVGYEGLKRCTVYDKDTHCSEEPEGPVLGTTETLRSYHRKPTYSTPPPSLPKELTGGKSITDYAVVNNQPLWVDCDEEATQCRMRWNGHAQGKTFYRIPWDSVLIQDDQVAYIAEIAKEGDVKVIWGQSEGDTYKEIWGFTMLNHQPVYAAEHSNSLNYLIRGRQKEAFRSIKHLEVESGTLFLVGNKDPAPGKSPI